MAAAARLVFLAIVAAIFCPAAGAVDRGRLAAMPLPKQSLGPDAKALLLAPDSGVDTNADAARHAGAGLTAADLARSGRITGYTLDYVLPVGAGGRLLEVQTIAERYRDERAAAGGLTFWRRATAALGPSNGITPTATPFRVRVGDGAFGFQLRLRRAHQTVGYIGDVVFRNGDLLGAVFVTARDETTLRVRTLELAGRLLARMRRLARDG